MGMKTITMLYRLEMRIRLNNNNSLIVSGGCFFGVAAWKMFCGRDGSFDSGGADGINFKTISIPYI
jgi:hypothetical protein